MQDGRTRAIMLRIADDYDKAVATFTLVLTILGGVRYAYSAVPWLVGLTITAAYWFTSSTSFANPAVTLFASGP